MDRGQPDANQSPTSVRDEGTIIRVAGTYIQGECLHNIIVPYACGQLHQYNLYGFFKFFQCLHYCTILPYYAILCHSILAFFAGRRAYFSEGTSRNYPGAYDQGECLYICILSLVLLF